jgi:hypothetical protein
MGLLISICGICSALVALAANFYRPIREVETILPEHDQMVKAAENPA